jgi:hypothetical protein
MLGLELVVPLEDDWQVTLSDVARSRGWPTSGDVAKLGRAVAALSRAYNDDKAGLDLARDAGAARLGFWFPRDVPKGAGAVREVVASGALTGVRRLRLLDVGAGLGAMTWGFVRALEAAGAKDLTVDATWLDADAAALDLGAAIVRARAGRGPVELRLQTMARPVDRLGGLGLFDVVLVGQVLSELDPTSAPPRAGASPETRVERHAAMLRALLERHVEPSGFLVVVEPALRDRTRHLHRVRDVVSAAGVTVFAPCLHGAPCPALARDTDWCHEDLPVDLPRWLAPVARAAGLRHQGLTFSYLVLTRAQPPLSTLLTRTQTGARLRVVSNRSVTKGKQEVFLCGEFSGEGEGPRRAGRARVARLDRDASLSNDAWDGLARGELLVVDPAPALDRARVGPGAAVNVAPLARRPIG